MALEHVESAAVRFERIVDVERTVREDDGVAGIVASAAEHDLVVLGATRRGRLRRGASARSLGSSGETSTSP